MQATKQRLILLLAILAVAAAALLGHPASGFAQEPAQQPNATGGTTQQASPHGKKIKPWIKIVHGREVIRPKVYAKHLVCIRWSCRHWPAFYKIIWHESKWKAFDRPGVPNYNDSGSDACGLPMALPCHKIPNPKSVTSQLKWGVNYIAGRYGNPIRAWAFWQAHSWYKRAVQTMGLGVESGFRVIKKMQARTASVGSGSRTLPGPAPNAFIKI